MSASASVIDDLLASLPADEIPVRDVRLGPFWTVFSRPMRASICLR